MTAAPERTLVSPDGLLHLSVRATDGGSSLGFEGFPWHTHSDVLATRLSAQPEAAVEHWVDDVITGKLVIALSKVRGVIQDAWVTDNPTKERRFRAADETIEFRLWDGTRLKV